MVNTDIKGFFSFLIISLFLSNLNAAGQTTLTAGDIMIVTCNADGNDEFDFVPLIDLENGTEIHFTDNAWNGSSLNSNEGTLTYTASSAISAGTVISYTRSTGGNWSSSGSYNASGSGDNILVYQGTSGSPSFILGVGWASGSTWISTGTVSTNDSYEPSGLSSSSNTIISLGTSENYQYNTTNGTSGTKSELLALAANSSNFNSNNSSAYSALSTSFTVNPSITISETELTDFSYAHGSGPSTEQSFTVEGSNLTNDIDITAPTNYEISTGTGGSFSPTSPITLTQSSGSVSETTIYVRLKSGLSTGSYDNEDITASSTGATSQDVTCSGYVVSVEPTTQASSVQFSSVGASGMTISWTSGNGSDAVVLVKEGSAVDTDPSDGTSYTANTIFSNGDEIGTDNYVVYSGSSNSVSITGLSGSTTYHVAVYEYNGSSGTENYLTTSPATGSQGTLNSGLQISANDTRYSIDFDATVSGVNNGGYQGTGFTAKPAAGELDAASWQITGLSYNTNKELGESETADDFSRETSTGGETFGGLYAFDLDNTAGTNYSFGIQPSTSDFNPGGIILLIQNQTGGTISSLSISYDIYVYNDEDRSSSFNFSHSSDNNTYNSISSLDLTSAESADASPSWKRYFRSTKITGLTISDDSYYYLKWSGSDAGGSGSRDEFALDNISIIANPSSVIPSLSNNLEEVTVSGDVEINGDITVSGNVNISSGSIKIPSGNSLSVDGTLSNSAGNSGIIIESDASGSGALIHNSSVSGTVKRYVSGSSNGKIHYVSAAVSSASGSDIIDASKGNYAVYEYLNSQSWSQISGSDDLTPGKAYYVAYNANKTIEFTGTLNYQNLSSTTAVTISSTENDWNLLGNPYTAPIACNDLVSNNSNLDGTLKFWDDDASGGSSYTTADYATWSGIGSTSASAQGNSPDNYIAPGQGFFVQSSSNATTDDQVEFQASWRTTQDPKFFIPETEAIPKFWLNLTNNKLYNEILIGFKSDATTGYDRLYDSKKLKGNPDIALYSYMPENLSVQLDIQALPLPLETYVIPLGLHVANPDKYTFNLKRIENIFNNVDIYLEDLETDQMINLREEKSYIVQLDSGEYHNRFLIHFNPEVQGNIKPEKTLTTRIYSFENNIYVQNNDAEKLSMRIFDAMGKLILSKNLNAQKTHRIETVICEGYYFVQIISKNTVVSKKVFISSPGRQ